MNQCINSKAKLCFYLSAGNVNAFFPFFKRLFLQSNWVPDMVRNSGRNTVKTREQS